MMNPHEYDALGGKAAAWTITADELERLNLETNRRWAVLQEWADKELLAKPLGPCGACGHPEVMVNPIPVSMSVVAFCAACSQARKLWSNVGEPG